MVENAGKIVEKSFKKLYINGGKMVENCLKIADRWWKMSDEQVDKQLKYGGNFWINYDEIIWKGVWYK